MKKITLLITLLITSLLIFGCTTTQNNTNFDSSQLSLEASLKSQENMIKFEDYDEIRTFLEDQTTQTQYYGGIAELSRQFSATGKVAMDSVASNEAVAPQASEFNSDDGSTNTDYSTTNVQVEGVDEADMVKTDGKYIYYVSRKTLFIVDSEDLKIQSEIKFNSYPQDIYINENKLSIFGNDYDNTNIARIYPRTSFTFFKVFDVTDKKNPEEIKDISFEGNYRDSRMIDGEVIFITQNYANTYAYDENEPIVPRLLIDEEKVENRILPDIYYFPIPSHSYSFTTISKINLNNLEQNIKQEVYMMSYGQNIYVSKDNLYITYTKYISEYDLLFDITKEICIWKTCYYSYI